MVERFMLVALGFLTATLFALIAVQFARRRAVTVTTREPAGPPPTDDTGRRTHETPGLDVAPDANRGEIAALRGSNATREEAIVSYTRGTPARHEAAANAHTREASDRAEARAQAKNLALLRERIAELETVIRQEIDRRSHAEALLKKLGEKAARLALEINEAVTTVADAKRLRAVVAPLPAELVPAAPQPEAVAPLAAAPLNDRDEMRALAEIKASLSDLNAASSDLSLADNDGEGDGDERIAKASFPGERRLAERIRALQAGVAS
jgi:hypothetical protein